MARITVHGLELEIIIGFWPKERKKKQRVVIHITYETDGKAAIAKDDVAHTVDYNTLVERLSKKVRATEFNILERLTQFVLDGVMEEEKITYAKVVVEKPDAPVKGIKGISCEMEVRR